jgi:Holliday junction DNA helicase RuvB
MTIKNNKEIDNFLRPQSLNDFIGQHQIKRNLTIFIQASKKRKEPLDHCLFYAPSGLGKTTLAHIIAKEMGGNFKIISGPTLEKVGDLATILTNLSKGDIFFIDEIHRINHMIEESLYSAMEDFRLDIIIGRGPAAKTIKLPIPHFTLIGATTKAGLISTPMRSRFGIIEHLEFYSIDDIIKILDRSATIMGIAIDEKASQEIAKCARGTPRLANRLLKRVRDFSVVEANNSFIITQKLARRALQALELDNLGLSKMDRLILTVLVDKFNGGPVGIDTIATILSEDKDTLVDVYEPYLLQSGFLIRTARGRIITKAGYDHICNKEK